MKTHTINSQSDDDSFELFPLKTYVSAAIEEMKLASSVERGAVFTRSEVVDFMLDLIGYTEDRPLWKFRLLEPSFGGGEFFLKALDRLLVSAKRDRIDVHQLHDSLRGVELHHASYHETRDKVRSILFEAGFSKMDTDSLLGAWLLHDDFLLTSLPSGFNFVIGNPPYVRQELIPNALLSIYRQRYTTLYDRADLYVLFMERSIELLGKQGQLAFICSDRWMKNRYGGPLRRMISETCSLRYYVDMVGTDAFQTEVIAYPAITVIEKGRTRSGVRVSHQPEISSATLDTLCRTLKGPPSEFKGVVSEVDGITEGDNPWLLESDALPSMDLVRRLEAAFPKIEDAGCTVGIGVATGADKIFIGRFDDLNVEEERKLPLATTKDILSGKVQWQGLGVINPFEEDGSLADFNSYPRFAAHMEYHQEALKNRHCAKRKNGSWYRTIDRITPALAKRPKLLIPDIKGEANIVLDESGLYPHHNLYYITSREWPLIALQRVMLAGIAHLFVKTYSTKMRGGCLRFQAQYLRRIRLPRWQSIPNHIKITLNRRGDIEPTLLQEAVAIAYNLNSNDLKHVFH